MRIAHVFNMANCGWSLVKGLRTIGIDAHLFFERRYHVACLPQWEEADIDLNQLGDLYDPNWDVINEHWSMPDYAHVWDMRGPRFAAIFYPIRFFVMKVQPKLFPQMGPIVWKLLKAWNQRIFEREVRRTRLRDYDLVVGHAPFAQYALNYQALLRQPYVIYDAGWIRYLHNPTYASSFYRLAETGYKHASKILFTNVDTYELFLRNGYDSEKLVYTPFALDTNIYRPMRGDEVSINRDGSPVFLMTSRADPTKGNEAVFYAFQRYLKRRPKAVLRVVNWGPEQENHQEHLSLVKKLNIQKQVRWLPLMNKRLLVRHFNAADIVFDQFKLGALGITTPEAMSCGRPVVSYVKPELWAPWHEEPPPVANARTAEQIYRQMIALEDEALRRDFGAKGREWVFENCEMSMVARSQLPVYEELMRH